MSAKNLMRNTIVAAVAAAFIAAPVASFAKHHKKGHRSHKGTESSSPAKMSSDASKSKAKRAR
jgi:hypothetical protein